jgi:hypothetical protein
MGKQGGWQGLLPAGTTNQDPRPLFLVMYDYVESGVTERCGFICHAEDVRGAAESFWNQHPGEWFRLISVNDGRVEQFWLRNEGKFVTVPEREAEL